MLSSIVRERSFASKHRLREDGDAHSMSGVSSSSSFPFDERSRHHQTSPQQRGRKVTIAIMRETYDKWERRAPLTPAQVGQLLLSTSRSSSPAPSSDLRVLVQPSPARVFSDAEYARVGAVVSEDLAEADVIFGVKRPKDPASLLPGKTYLFFSHTVKGQPENMGLLQECLEKRIQLMDYERIVGSVDEMGRAKRLVSFGRFAGVAGMMYAIHAVGRRLFYRDGTNTPFLSFPPAWQHDSLEEAKKRILKMGERMMQNGINSTEPLVFAVTGGGSVHHGALEILELLPHELVTVEELPELFRRETCPRAEPRYKVHIVPVATKDMFQKRNNSGDADSFDRGDFQEHPADYDCTFSTRVAPFASVIVNCIYWDARFPRLLTKQQVRQLFEGGNERLLVVADISCDVHGSMEFLSRTTTIEKPFFQYDPISEREVADDIGNRGVTVMGVDILPTELPRESSEHFGDAVIGVVQELVAVKQCQDEGVAGVDMRLLSPQLTGACITTVDGALTPRFRYLQELLKKKSPASDPHANRTMVLSLEGRLFGSDLINQVLDEILLHECGFRFQECIFPPDAVEECSESLTLLLVTAREDSTLSSVQSRIESLIIDLCEDGDTQMRRIDSSRSNSET